MVCLPLSFARIPSFVQSAAGWRVLVQVRIGQSDAATLQGHKVVAL